MNHIDSPGDASFQVAASDVLCNAQQRRVGWMASLLWRYPRLLARVARIQSHCRPAARRVALGLSAAALIIALSNAPTHAAAIEVIDGEVAVSANGRCSLIEAIHNANDGNDGVVHEDCAPGDVEGADEVVLPAGGLFPLTAVDNETYGATGLPVITSTVTLTGNGATIRREAEGKQFRIAAVSATGDLTLIGTTLSNGYATYGEEYPGHWAAISGGGILSAGTLTVRDSVIIDGNARNDAGGVFVMAGTTLIENSTIKNNHAGDGGGITNNGGELTVRRSIVSGNGGYTGSGILNFGPLTIEGSAIYDNHGRTGGGLTNYVGPVTIKDSIFHTNSRNAITNQHVMVITGSTIMNNGGAGGISSSGPLTIVNSTISGNEGGGLFVSSNTTQVIQSTITGNSSTYGGGVFVSAFFDEWFSYDCYYGLLELENSIVSGNTGTVGREIYAQFIYSRCFGEVGAYRSLIGHDGDPGVKNVSVDPRFVPGEPLAAILRPSLDWNGGLTPTHALPTGSPAIDVAPSGACAATPVDGVDQRGWARNIDGDGVPSELECDLGAFEWQSWPHEVFLPVAGRR